MPKRIEFNGEVHEFPDDFTDADIAKALGGSNKPLMVPFKGGFRPVTPQEKAELDAAAARPGNQALGMATDLAATLGAGAVVAPALAASGAIPAAARAALSPSGMAIGSGASTLYKTGNPITALEVAASTYGAGRLGMSKALGKLLGVGAEAGWTEAQQRAAMKVAADQERAIAMNAARSQAAPVARGTSSYVAGQAVPEVAPVTNVVPFRGAPPAAPKPVAAVPEGVPAGASMEDALRQSIAAGGKAIPRDNVATFTKLLNQDPAKAAQFLEGRIVDLRKTQGLSGAQIQATLKDTYGIPMRMANDIVRRVLAAYPEIGTGAMR